MPNKNIGGGDNCPCGAPNPLGRAFGGEPIDIASGNMFNSTTYYKTAGQNTLAPDHLGSPHQITDPTGAVVWQWNLDPFGNGAPIGSLTYDLRFPGQFFDQTTYLHHNFFRDYDPRLATSASSLWRWCGYS
jgi:hypothetical protein